jgi:hypothetical protein
VVAVVAERETAAKKRTTKKTVNDQFVNDLIKQQEEALQEAVRETKRSLNGHKYYDLDEESKVEFLCSKKGQTLIQNLAKKRVSFANIAETFAFTQKKLHAVARDNEEIYDAIDRGRASELDEVEKNLYKLAKGETVSEKTIITEDSGRGNRDPKVIVQERERYIPPNFFASKYLLEQKREMEYRADLARQNMELNRVNLEIVVIGQDELQAD